jgi:hypothetical protein
MAELPDRLDLAGVPVHVQSWNVAKIPGFVFAVLSRWQRAHGDLPERFYLTMCPQVEINTLGGLPTRVIELTDPRLTCRHFTGCNKPYFVVIFTGEDARTCQHEVQELLPWSESYEVQITASALRLTFAGASEDLEWEEDGVAKKPRRTLQELLEKADLVSILE